MSESIEPLMVSPEVLTSARRLIAGDPQILARAISWVENGLDVGSDIYQEILPHCGNALVVGVTGPPGSGKSTLVGSYVSVLRNLGRKVAVVAIDPSSPLTGGALLGDRIRMSKHAEDRGVFIRSLGSRGDLGGMTCSTYQIVDLIDAAGWDVIIVETVGAGQSDSDVAALADVSVVLCAPGAGDQIQALKAGILEVADVLVVNKSDMPQAMLTSQQLRTMLETRRITGGNVAELVNTTAILNHGLSEFHDAITRVAKREVGRPKIRAEERARRTLLSKAAKVSRDRILKLAGSEVEKICSDYLAGRMSQSECVERLIFLCTG